MNVLDVRRSITQNELVRPSEKELSIFKGKIKTPEYLNRIYKVNKHLYNYVYVNDQNGNIMCVAVTVGTQVHPIITDDIIKMKDSRYYEALKDGDFKYCIMLSDGQYKFLTFDLIKDKVPKKLLCDLFLEAYECIDYGFKEMVKALDISEILKLRRLSQEELSSLSEYMDGNGDIIIYRAQGSQSTPLKSAISWTVDLDVAQRFANEHNLECDGVIYEARVCPQDITAYVENRDEAEIIVDYKFLKNIKKY